MEFLQLMANSCVKSCLTTITFLLVIVNHTHVGNCQSLCLTGTYLGTLSDGSKDCLFCRENCGFGYEKVEDCTAESDIKCRKCSNGTFYDKQDMTCKNCTECANHNEIIKNCTSSTDTVCKNNTSKKPRDEGDENGSIIIASVTAVCVSLTVITVVALICKCRHRRKKNNLTSDSVKMTSVSHTHETDDVNTSLLTGEQGVKTETSTVTHVPKTEEAKEYKDNEKEDKSFEVNHPSQQVPPEQNSTESPGVFKTVAVHVLNNFASNDFILHSELSRSGI